MHDMGKGLKDVREHLTPEVNALIEDLIEDDLFDEVERPEHYNSGNIETYEYIVDVMGKYFAIFYCWGNILKYLGSRLWKKGDPVTNAKKARWYLDKMIILIEETEGTNW